MLCDRPVDRVQNVVFALVFEVFEFLGHGWVAASEAFDGQVFDFVFGGADMLV